MTPSGRDLRADLHVHSYHSGYARHLPFLRTRDCYSEPAAVYRIAKARGMDLVTITDHDSIGGCLEFLNQHPDAADFFISEEIECRFPDAPLRVHLGVYGISERIHREVQRLRANVYDVAAYLREQRVCFALNHLFFFFNRQVPLERYLNALLPLCPAVEVRNGTMTRQHNDLVDLVLRYHREAGATSASAVGGSDSHTLGGVATTYTLAPGRNRDEFLESVRAGRARPGGRHGGTLRVAREIYGVIGRYWASLVGVGRQELSWSRRGLGLAWSIASLPAEFTPLLVASVDKAREVRRIAGYRADWGRARAAGVGRDRGGPAVRTAAADGGE
jgi:predicted metal-dependent phosphoesterase TrpH